MQLTPGRYQTRNSRNVELFESFEREKPIGMGQSKKVTIWRGRLYTQSGAFDSSHEWEETLLPNTYATFVSVGRSEGVASEFDLIYKYPAAA
jgi:hypothetical protein